METAADLRILQTSTELERLGAAVDNWEGKRKAADVHPGGNYRGQYQTQVALIVKEVRNAIRAVAGALGQLRINGATWPVAGIYQECARYDRRVIWLWRAWDYFRQKFDQRDDPALRDAVRAADEVLWSCYKPFFDGLGLPRPAPPLPYIENTYSPTALRPDDSGHLEKNDEVENSPLKDFFNRLPVPLLQLPPITVSAPWTQVLIAHETGHFVQEFVPAPRNFRDLFRERLQAIAASAGGDDAASVWGRWAPEIFADLYSVAACGVWAVWVMAQFELARAGKPTTRGRDYPSPLVRIWLLAQFAAEAGLTDGGSIVSAWGIDPAAEALNSPEVRVDLEIAAQVAPLIRENIVGAGRSLPSLLGLQADDFRAAAGFDDPGEVVQWAEVFRGSRKKGNSNNVKAARLVAAGAAQAWSEILVMGPGDARNAAMTCLRGEAFSRMALNAEAGTRAGTLPAAGKSLADAIFAIKEDDLFR